jgi:hypothetical protein
MEASDVDGVIRLAAAIQASAAESVGPTSAQALIEAADRYRRAVDALLPEELAAEFRVLFPPDSAQSGTAVTRNAELAARAHEQLVAMAAWASGLPKGAR